LADEEVAGRRRRCSQRRRTISQNLHLLLLPRPLSSPSLRRPLAAIAATAAPSLSTSSFLYLSLTIGGFSGWLEPVVDGFQLAIFLLFFIFYFFIVVKF